MMKNGSLSAARRFLALLGALALAGCAGPLDGNGGDEPPDTSFNTKRWVADGAGYTQFLTNDPANKGSVNWYWLEPAETTMSSVEVEVKKISGDSLMGYGAIFCLQDESNFLWVAIDTSGWYSVFKYVDGVNKTIHSWTEANAGDLYTGYSVKNTIKIVYNGSTSKFSIYFNGTLVYTFADNQYGTPLSGGKSGFIVGVSDMENFPDTPVDVRFKRLRPSN